MDIAVFSDIHSNYKALQSCFDYCTGKGITRFIFLGDYICDLPYPKETLKFLNVIKNHFDCVFLKGKKDQELIDYWKKGGKGFRNGSAKGTFLYTYEELSVNELNFIERMPLYLEYDKYSPHFEVCHASPFSLWEPVFRDKRNTRKILSNLKTDLLIHGANHVPDYFEYNDKKCINPGSVGLPLGYGGKTQFMIIHGDQREWIYENIRIDYDKETVYRDFEESGLMERAPAWCALLMHNIRYGEDLSDVVKLRAIQLCKKERGKAIWPNIPEIFWALALRENKIDLSGKKIKEIKD